MNLLPPTFYKSVLYVILDYIALRKRSVKISSFQLLQRPISPPFLCVFYFCDLLHFYWKQNDVGYSTFLGWSERNYYTYKNKESLKNTISMVLNTFWPNVLFLYPRKTSESRWFSEVFRWYRNETLG